MNKKSEGGLSLPCARRLLPYVRMLQDPGTQLQARYANHEPRILYLNTSLRFWWGPRGVSPFASLCACQGLGTSFGTARAFPPSKYTSTSWVQCSTAPNASAELVQRLSLVQHCEYNLPRARLPLEHGGFLVSARGLVSATGGATQVGSG